MKKSKTSRTTHEAKAVRESKKQKAIKSLNSKQKAKKLQKDIEHASELANSPDHEEAMEFIDGLFTKYKRMPKDRKAHLYYLKGFTLHHGKEDYPKALFYYNLAISINPKSEGIYYYDRGLLKEALGNKTGRDEDFKTFVKITPELADLVED